MKKLIFGLLVSFFVLTNSYSGFSQSRSFFEIGSELLFNTDILEDRIITKGLFVEIKVAGIFGVVAGLKQKRFSKPVSSYECFSLALKFSTKLVNVAAGASADLQLSGLGAKTDFGLFAKLSKDFILSNRFYFEPELMYNHQVDQVGNYLGLGLRLKYLL